MFGFNELSTPVKAIIALALVLLLVVIAGLILRRVAGGGLKLTGQANRARQPRLGIVDIFEMDRQRQLVLLRRDNVEHLVMIGGPNDLVIEASILRTGARAQVPMAAEGLELPPLPEQVVVTPPLPLRRPPQMAPEPVPASVPTPLSPPAPPPPTIAPTPAASVPAASAPAAPAYVQPARSAKPSPDIAAAGAAAAGIASLAASANAAPAPAPAPVTGPAAAQPSPANSPQQPAVQPAPIIEPRFPITPPTSPQPPLKPIIEPIAPPAAAKASPNELDDMTRQLEEALKRPFSGVKAPNSFATASIAQSYGAATPVPPVNAPTTPAPDAAPPSQPKRDDADAAIGDNDAPPLSRREASTKDADKPMSGLALPQDRLHERHADKDELAADGKAPIDIEEDFPLDFERELTAALSADRPDMAQPQVVQPGPRSSPAPTLEPALVEASRKSEADKPKVDASSRENSASDNASGVMPSAASVVAAEVVTDEHALAQWRPDTETSQDQPGKAREPHQPAAQPALKPAAEAAAPVEPPKAAAVGAGSSSLDPFSVDAIEAEFARLLNRSAPSKN